jgi:hypothetical protein
VYAVRGTKKFLDRFGRPSADVPTTSTALGEWYVTVLFWRPQVALFVNAVTFLPVLMPLAPTASVLGRFPSELANVMNALGIDPRFVAAEVDEMREVGKTASRQVLGVMNEFAFMAEHSISTGHSDSADLLGLSVWLSNTTVGPLTKGDGYAPLGALQRLVSATITEH